MTSRSLFLLSILAISIGAVGASERVREPAWPVESVVSAFWSSGRNEIIQVSDSISGEAAGGELPKPLSASPPADPDLPAWGRYLNPNSVSAALPPAEYELVGPPNGFLHQNADDQRYRAIVSDPDSVLAMDDLFGQSVDLKRPDGMAPIGMFGDHTLPAGKAFISYRYLQNAYERNYVGSSRAGVPAGYPFAPTHMLQNSQVALVEYGATQDFTVLAWLPFQHNEINSQTSTGQYHATFTNPGDIRLMGLLVVGRGDRSQSHVNFGLSLPVGFLEQSVFQSGGSTTVGPSSTVPNLPYQLRTSSGTYDVLLGYTYRRQTDFWTWGGQVNGVIPTGKNTLNYELGNQLQATTWLSRRWSDRWSTSARLDGRLIENIHGADVRLVQSLSPANQPHAQASRSVTGLLGVNYLLNRPGHRIGEQRLFLESGVPLYQWVDGQQLGLTWTLNAGWGMAY